MPTREERIILSDVPADKIDQIIQAMKGYFASDLIYKVYPIGAKNPSILTSDPDFSQYKIREMTTFAIGACWGITATRGY